MNDRDRLRELLASPGVSAETKDELKTFVRDLEQGQLHADDAAYVAALHARLIGGAEAIGVDAGSSLDPDSPFAQVLAEFDRLYHPEHGVSAVGDKASRDAMHAEFSSFLRRKGSE